MLQFKINKIRWESLVSLKGWEHPINALAKATGYGKSYCSQVINGGISISHDFMCVYIEVCGANPGNPGEWSRLFDITKEPTKSKSNFRKYEGQLPYVMGVAGLSESGRIRTKDRAKNLERLDMPVPIPAIDFYDDAMPSRANASYRYGK